MNTREINQIGRYISIIQRNSQKALNHRLNIEDLTASKSHLLLFINDYEKVTAQQVSDQLAINKGLVSRDFNELLQSGYIAKSLDSVDHRSYRVTLTEKGKQACIQINKIMSDWWLEQFEKSNSENLAITYQELYKLAVSISGSSLKYSNN